MTRTGSRVSTAVMPLGRRPGAATSRESDRPPGRKTASTHAPGSCRPHPRGAEHHLFPTLPPQHQEARAFLLHEGGGARDPLGEEAPRRLQHGCRRQRYRGRVRHGRARIVIPVGCSGTAMLATLVFVWRSITFTAPGSTPLLSCETKAYRPSGAYATPCGDRKSTRLNSSHQII